MSDDLERRIRERAFELWEAEGQPEGRDAHHWTQAEAEFADARAVESTASAPTAPERNRRDRSPKSAAPSLPDAPAGSPPKRSRSGARKATKS